MNKNLLIVGAGSYGLVAREIAESMRCFEEISFVDDNEGAAHEGIKVLGSTKDIDGLAKRYSNVIVAIGNATARLSILQRLEEEIPCKIATLVSPRAYVAPTAQIGRGCIIEPMATVHTHAVLLRGCIVSAGAVVNHASVCGDGSHVDCNATVASCSFVPTGTKVESGGVFKNREIKAADFFAREEQVKSEEMGKRTPRVIDGKTYNFDEVM